MTTFKAVRTIGVGRGGMGGVYGGGVGVDVGELVGASARGVVCGDGVAGSVVSADADSPGSNVGLAAGTAWHAMTATATTNTSMYL